MAKNLVNFGQGTLPWQPVLWHETVETATSWHETPWFVLAFTMVGKIAKTYTYTETLDVSSSLHLVKIS